ncbi:hypothetical protein V5O48_007805 [Marasmius crinis-equi]|uniref:Uncharacterized protein n=1 Tax=Marasmius crinis-equi TaxID=585013 RepID=A0ABR3FFP8_9AGAR
MATRPPLATVPQAQQQANTNGLCDYCNQKPKFSNHNYCSKKCASQAVNLCNYCQKKPKFQNFDFCGKTCASLAQAGGNAQQQPRPQASSGKSTNPPGASRGSKNQNAQQNGTIDPMQVAKLVIQHIPQLQSLLNPPQSHAAAQPVYQASSVPASSQPVNLQTAAKLAASSILGNTSRSAPQGFPNAAGAASISSINMPAPSSQKQNAQCRIPDCGKPVHIDPNGMNTSEYCSMSHRQEAVSTGLVEPCIMCLDLPQSEMDYFCGRACREEALDKQLIPARDDD